jgi:hypothetical protein
MGRSKRSGKPRYNAEVHAAIVKHLKAGAYKAHAAQAAGVSVDAVDDWLALGRAGDRRYASFARDVDRACGEDACRAAAVITAAAVKGHVGDWKAAAWMLERKYPRICGRSAEPAVGVTIGHGKDDEDGAPRTRVEFYLPDNGRRPDHVDAE